ncbi:MAG TPA: GNAT family N-acetyltransferase [Candidatus Rubrimentiphilum sp.]|nr:GNAT family N-acetyltransferase [Candidatus Rubrimentiphilum sp.]
MKPRAVETPRLILRQWCDADLDTWAQMNADPHVMEFFTERLDRASSDEVAAKMRARIDRDGYGLWAVEIKETGAFAGLIGLNEMAADIPVTPKREVGWRLAFDAWGRGYATEGARAALQFAFDELGWPEVVAVTAVINKRSQRVMERLGMIRDPDADFDHPRVPEGNRLRRHMLFRIDRERAARAVNTPA